jgi:hypothetical protein
MTLELISFSFLFETISLSLFGIETFSVQIGAKLNFSICFSPNS